MRRNTKPTEPRRCTEQPPPPTWVHQSAGTSGRASSWYLPSQRTQGPRRQLGEGRVNRACKRMLPPEGDGRVEAALQDVISLRVRAYEPFELQVGHQGCHGSIFMRLQERRFK